MRRRDLRIALILVICCQPILADEKPLFEEKFSGRLADGWQWIDELPGTWQLADDSLDMKVMPVGEGLWREGLKHPNLLVRDPGAKRDFAVEVQLKSNPTGQYEHAGLLLYADGDNYVAITKEMFAQTEIMMNAEKESKPATVRKPYEHEDVGLRLVVGSTKVIGQFRHDDSDEWQTLAEQDLPVPGPYKVGVIAGEPPTGADHRVRFSRFRIQPVIRAQGN